MFLHFSLAHLPAYNFSFSSIFPFSTSFLFFFPSRGFIPHHLRYNELLPILSRLKELEDTQEALETDGKSRMGHKNHASHNKKKAGR